MKNKKIILTVGIPASGKSTWAKKYVKENSDYVRISRDDFRYMIQSKQFLDPKGEKFVTDLVYESIKNAVRNKYNVIVDQTNVNDKYLNQLIDVCQRIGDLEFKIFDIPLKTAIDRDKNRDNPVGEEIIKKMYKNYLNLFDTNFNFSTRKKLPKIENDIKWEFNKKPKAIIFDIDGTLAHNNGKRGYYDWDNVHLDVVDEKVREVLNVFRNSHYHIIIVTGRDGSCEELTKMWLDENDINYDDFYIRTPADFRKDAVVKKEIFDKISNKYNILGVFDDRNQVVKMWRELGVKCFQVIDGDY